MELRILRRKTTTDENGHVKEFGRDILQYISPVIENGLLIGWTKWKDVPVVEEE